MKSRGKTHRMPRIVVSTLSVNEPCISCVYHKETMYVPQRVFHVCTTKHVPQRDMYVPQRDMCVPQRDNVCTTKSISCMYNKTCTTKRHVCTTKRLHSCMDHKETAKKGRAAGVLSHSLLSPYVTYIKLVGLLWKEIYNKTERDGQ